nr:aldehyde ferredoxin oxidoreductase C-terminal domain-containing protein [Desulforamulus putei]
MVLEGCSATPVYLEISDRGVAFKEAAHIWGRDTFQTEDTLLKEVNEPGAQAVVIGPAGEKQVRFACLGGLCCITDMDEIIYLNDLCDRLGIDTITAGNLVALAMDAAARGKADLSVSYGDASGAARLLKEMALREGAGAALSDGIVPAAAKLGMAQEAVHVKGMEPAGYDPRILKGVGLGYATSARGACHMSAWPVAEEAYGDRDAFTIESKAEFVIGLQHYNALKFSLILCDFWALSFDRMAELLSFATGEQVTASQLEKAGEAIFNMARLFNLREGFSKQEDTLPRRIFNDCLPSGVSEGKRLSEEKFKKMLYQYYQLRDWDNNGVPTAAKLAELGLA